MEEGETRIFRPQRAWRRDT